MKIIFPDGSEKNMSTDSIENSILKGRLSLLGKPIVYCGQWGIFDLKVKCRNCETYFLSEMTEDTIWLEKL